MGMPRSMNFNCPKCGSIDVVMSLVEKYVQFYRCNSCGFVREPEIPLG